MRNKNYYDKIMGKIFATLLVLIILSVPISFVLSGEGDPCDTNSDCGGDTCFCDPNPGDGNLDGICSKWTVICSPTRYTSFQALVESITGWIFKITLIIGPLMIILGGIIFMTGRGNPNQVEKGKKIIYWTLIGFLIVMSSAGLFNLIKYILGVV
jgi:hypothetical protein